MSRAWQKSKSSVDDPLKNYHHKPIVGVGGPNQTYLGRLIVELLDDGSARDDASKLALLCDAMGGKYSTIARRIATALPARVQRDQAFQSPGPSPTSTPSGGWQVSAGPADDPLVNYQKKPVVGVEGPNQTYVGRVIAELWDDGTTRDDSYKLALSSSAVNGDHAQFLQRIAPALQKRSQKGLPFKDMPSMDGDST